MGTYASDARAAIGRCRVTARYTVERLRRESVQLAPCYGWHRQRVRADLERCQRCGMLLCDVAPDVASAVTPCVSLRWRAHSALTVDNSHCCQQL
jgi:hypothetical protein